MGPDHNWCSACGRSDNDACAKCEALKVDLGHAQRFLAHESDLNKRLGEGNRELQKLLGVQYPGGINERALEIIAERDKLRQLLRDVEQIEADRAAELLPVERDLGQLKATVRRHIETPDDDLGRLTTAVRALIYLRDPYDAVMDQYIDFGLQDDVALIRSAAQSLASDQAVKSTS
jgi:hypothetical protein